MEAPLEPVKAWDLKAALAGYPWPAGWAEAGPRAEVCWTFDLPISREELWPLLADTSTINRDLRLPPIDFTEVGGRAHAVSGQGFSQAKWVEQPWQWEFARRMSYERIYEKGLPRYIRTLNVLEEPRPGHTRLLTYTGMVARGRVGAFLFKAYMRSFRPKYDVYLREAVERLKSRADRGAVEPIARAAGRARAQQLRAALLEEHGQTLDPKIIGRLWAHVLDGDPLELSRIRVRPLARRWQVAESSLLDVCLFAAARGLLSLRWDVVCPHCRGMRGEVEHLGQIPPRESCAPCGIEFDTGPAETMEVTFRVHPQIRQIDERIYCAAEPATKPHIRVQRTLAPGEDASLATLLPAGRYQLRLKGQEPTASLRVEANCAERVVGWSSGGVPGDGPVGPRPQLALSNDGADEVTFVVEESRREANALRPAEVFSRPAFRRCFDDEGLGFDLALDLGVQTILFTDVVGSTKFYLEAGDAEAFSAVRRQFVIAYEIVERLGGVVVKTIGDAVMAAFASADDGLRAAVALQEAFDGTGECTLRIRVTLHTGPCLAVNLNTGVDYFGSTVNLAAKIQSEAGAGEVAWTEATAEAADVAAVLGPTGKTPQELAFAVAKDAPTHRVFRVKIS